MSTAPPTPHALVRSTGRPAYLSPEPGPHDARALAAAPGEG